MLYGMDDEEEYDYEDNLSLMNKPKLNIKKVIIVVAIILAGILIIFSSFSVSYKIMNKSNENNFSMINNEENLDNNEVIDREDEVEIEQDKLAIIQNNNKKDEKVYEGNHVQIAEHNVENLEVKMVPVYNPDGHQIIKDIYTSEEKQVYLTFDDGPSKDITPQILDILKESDVKATFFVLGARVDLYPSTLKREYDEGHYIANHGYSHIYSQIYQNIDTVFQEYNDCEVSIKRALNNEDYNSYLFRFPGGSSGGRYSSVKAEARELLLSRGIAFTNWNCLTGDAENKKTKEACMEEMINTRAGQNSIVLLMHDANDKQQTVDALPEIIQYYKNEGYTFKTFYEVFK